MTIKSVFQRFTCSKSKNTEKKKDDVVRTKNVHVEDDGGGMSIEMKDESKKQPLLLFERRKDSSLFFSCRQSLDEFDEETRNGLLQLEKSGIFDEKILKEAIKEDLCKPVIVEQDDKMDGLDYAPATVMDPYRPEDITLAVPNTLLFGKDNQNGVTDIRDGQSSFNMRVSMVVKEALEDPMVKIDIPGYPGQLSAHELNACMELRAFIIQESNKEMKEIVLALYGIESDEYALCRRLRSRHFVVKDAIHHLQEGVQIWKQGKAANFYPSARDALGADPSIVLSLFPYMYSGFAKNGCPVLYFKGGQTNMEGLECVMEISDLEKFAWHMFMFKFKDVVRQSMKINGLVRTEQIVIMDLKNLSSKSILASAEILKMFTKVGTCFPELMNRTIIVNAPTFFAFAWKMLKSFLDERTRSKIAIYSNYRKGITKLQELIQDDQLLSDYGGLAPSFQKVMQSNGDNNIDNGSSRQIVKMLSKEQKSIQLLLHAEEECEVTVYTKSMSGAQFTIVTESNRNAPTLQVKNPDVVSGDEVKSYNIVISKALKGPNVYTIAAEPYSSSSKLDNFVVVGRVKEMI